MNSWTVVGKPSINILTLGKATPFMQLNLITKDVCQIVCGPEREKLFSEIHGIFNQIC